MELPKLYTSEEVAQALGFTPESFAQRRHRGQAPRHISAGNKTVRYRAVDVIEWLRENNPGIDFDVYANTAEASAAETAAHTLTN